jgi:hypothetical protein
MTDRNGVLDGQWHFAHHYPLAEAAYNTNDKVEAIRQEMNYPHNQGYFILKTRLSVSRPYLQQRSA